MDVTSWISPKAEKGAPSAIHGRGLVAREPITAGEVVAVKGGHVVDGETLRQLPDPLPNSEIAIADDLHRVAVTESEYEGVMLFLNHSCDPNVGFAGDSVLVAMRDVLAGEELTTDYALFDDHEGTATCRCRTQRCRGTIGGQDWRRPELQERYGTWFSAYLLRRFHPAFRPRRGPEG